MNTNFYTQTNSGILAIEWVQYGKGMKYEKVNVEIQILLNSIKSSLLGVHWGSRTYTQYKY